MTVWVRVSPCAVLTPAQGVGWGHQTQMPQGDRDAAWPCPGRCRLGKAGRLCEWKQPQVRGHIWVAQGFGGQGPWPPLQPLSLPHGRALIQLEWHCPGKVAPQPSKVRERQRCPDHRSRRWGSWGGWSVTTGHPAGHTQAAGWWARSWETPPGGERGRCCSLRDSGRTQLFISSNSPPSPVWLSG